MILSRYLHDSLDLIGIAACEYDSELKAVGWNETFLQFFPEDEGVIVAGESYWDNLERFYRGRLTPEEMPDLARYVAEGVARHENQTQPFEFTHHGRRLRASSLRAGDGGRVRMWQRLDVPVPVAGAPEILQPLLGALAFIPDGATILDAQGRIVANNEAFRQLYRLQVDRVVVGCTLDEIVTGCWQGASPAGPWRAAIRNGLRYDGAPFEVELPGQRWLRVVARHNGDGIGFFTHADMTSAKRQNRELLDAQEALRKANAELALLAQTDGLTGLGNRGRLLDALGKHAALSQPLTLLMIDVDHFKTVNDRFGHLVGDACLKLIAKTIAAQVQPYQGLAARLGGEEFGIVLDGHGLASGRRLAAALRQALAAAPWADVHPALGRVDISVGICSTQGPVNADALHACADDALYAAKRNGRNRVEILDLSSASRRIAG